MDSYEILHVLLRFTHYNAQCSLSRGLGTSPTVANLEMSIKNRDTADVGQYITNITRLPSFARGYACYKLPTHSDIQNGDKQNFS